MISEFDVEELVRGMDCLGDDVEVEDYVLQKYDCSWEAFCHIVSDLLPLIVIGESPLTGKMYRGFGKEGLFFIKQEIK